METLFVGSSPWSFAKHSNSIAFLRAIVAGHGSASIRGTRWRWFLDCVALAVVFVLAASPVLLLNTIQFHSPFKTGYDFWILYCTENDLLFSLRYIPENALALWRESTLRPNGFVFGHMFGTGTYSSSFSPFGVHGIVFCSAQLVRRLRFFRRIELFGSSFVLSV